MIDSGLGRRTNVDFPGDSFFHLQFIACSSEEQASTLEKSSRLTSFQDPGSETNFKGPEGAESLAKVVDVVFAHHAANRGESEMAGTATKQPSKQQIPASPGRCLARTPFQLTM